MANNLYIKDIKIQKYAGLLQIYATTNIVGNISVAVVDSRNNTVATYQSFYPSLEHFMCFWLPNDLYSLNFSTFDATLNKTMKFFAWGQTNIPFEYLGSEKNMNVLDFSGNIVTTTTTSTTTTTTA